MVPGELILKKEDVACNKGRATVNLEVSNKGDRPIQVGSHYHFFEVNRYLEFDRSKALGMRLNIPASTAIRFEPGEKKTVTLVAFGGSKKIMGFAGLVNGTLAEGKDRDKVMEKARKEGFIK